MEDMALDPAAEAQRHPSFSGFIDGNDRFITFEMADEVFERAHAIGARVLLRLALDEDGQLNGTMYTNELGLTPRRSVPA